MRSRLLALFNPARWLEFVQSNPVILKEMRSRMRGWRAAASISGFILLVSITAGMIYLGFAEAGSPTQGVTVRRTIGQTIFYTIFMVQLLIIGISSPVMTSSAIASEREHQTYDLLRTTLLSAGSLVSGKLIASVSFVMLLLFASLPVQSVGFIFGGVGLGEVLIAGLILVLTALTFGAVGLFFSSLIRNARIAAVLSQVVTLTFSIGLPVLGLFGIGMLGALFVSSTNPFPEWVLITIGWFIVAASPVATAVATEVILIEEQTLFAFQAPLGGLNVWVPSPWIGFTALYIALTAVFILITIRIVRRPER